MQLSISVSLHQQNLWFLLTKICKSTGTLNLQFMWLYFIYGEASHNLRRVPVLFIQVARSTIYGTNSVHFRESLIVKFVYFVKRVYLQNSRDQIVMALSDNTVEYHLDFPKIYVPGVQVW